MYIVLCDEKMEWEITIQTKNPKVVEAIMHQNIPAITHRDIEYITIKLTDAGD
ncbi:unnamed protein product [marine sediment metagenome]|uniref:Uncharacterized protein n=1 Tax=marine sediment metagenome TaxID=412755 RepID=X1GSN2_9ZZZZ